MVLSFDTLLKTDERSTTNVDLVDFISGTTNVTFFGMNALTDYLIVRNNSYSDDISTSGSNTTSSFVKVIDIDFEQDFNITQLLQGKSIISFFYRQFSNTSNTVSSYFTIKIIHYDGSTETELATSTTVIEAFVAANTGTNYNKSLSFDISKTKFKRGDTLIIRTEGYIKNSNDAGTQTLTLGHDPQNRDMSGSESLYRADIPFLVG